MDILETFDNLAEQELGIILFELSSPSDVGEEVSTTAHLHDINNMRFGVE